MRVPEEPSFNEPSTFRSVTATTCFLPTFVPRVARLHGMLRGSSR